MPTKQEIRIILNISDDGRVIYSHIESDCPPPNTYTILLNTCLEISKTLDPKNTDYLRTITTEALENTGVKYRRPDDQNKP